MLTVAASKFYLLVWIVTVPQMWGGPDVTRINTEAYLTVEECIGAKQMYAVGPNRKVLQGCVDVDAGGNYNFIPN